MKKPYQNSDLPIEERINDLLSRLSIEEKVWLCHGCSAMEVGGIERLDIPKVEFADGPQGVRLEDGRTTTSLPCGMALAASWDVANSYEFGALIAREANASNIHVSLGPGFNLMRTPLCGRNFEYYGEDPVLAGKIAAGYIKGCQANHVGATPKHLALNNQEICRTTGSSNIDERTLRELYLTAFEIVTHEASPWMMMSSYNKINGTFASAYHLTQQQIVKDEWGFDGVMVSDWGGAHDTEQCAKGGLDLEMGEGPTESVFAQPLLDLVQSGKVSEALIDEKVKRVLRLMYRVGVFDRIDRSKFSELNTPRHRAIACNLAADGIVLLKNRDNILPLASDKIKSIAIIGPNADRTHSMGDLISCGGSGAVHADYEITPLEGLKNFAKQHNIKVKYAEGAFFDNDGTIPENLFSQPDNSRGLKAEYFRRDQAGVIAEKPFLTVSDETMNHYWNEHSQIAINTTHDFPFKDFAVRWNGFFRPEKSETVRLQFKILHSNLKVWVDDQQLICTEGMPFDTLNTEIAVEAGRQYKISIEFVCTNPCPMMKMSYFSANNAALAKEEALQIAQECDVVLFCGGNNHLYDKEALGWGNVEDADIPHFDLLPAQAELINAISKVNSNLIVALFGGTPIGIESCEKQSKAILECFYLGMESGNALAKVLFGEVNPGAKLPFSWGKELNHYACHANGNYPGVRTGDNPHVNYDEGIFIGYRHFDRAQITPRYSFGYGLSYTTFALSNFEAKVTHHNIDNIEVTLKITVTNPGKRAGSEVIQVYVSDLQCSAERPKKELKSFKKVHLKPQESQLVELKLNTRDFAFFDPQSKQWTVEPGLFELYLGNSSDHLPFQTQIEVSK